MIRLTKKRKRMTVGSLRAKKIRLKKLAKKLYMSIEELSKYDNPFEAFVKTMQTLYPDPDKLNWRTISTTQAAKLYLEGIAVTNTVNSYRDNNILRSKDNQVYLEEVLFFRDMMKFYIILKDVGILSTQDILGKKMIVMHPEVAQKKNLSKFAQQIKAVAKISSKKWFQKWISLIDISDEN